MRPPTKLSLIRCLRSAVVTSNSRHADALFSLVNLYMKGEFGGLDAGIVSKYTSDVINRSTPTHLNKVFTSHSPVTTSMR